MLIIEPNAGLSNRILVIATACYYARLYKHSVTVLWTVDDSLGIAVEELFELPTDIRVVSITDRGIRKTPFQSIKSEIVKKRYKCKADIVLDCEDIRNAYMRKVEQGAENVEMDDVFQKHETLYIRAYTPLMPITDNRIFQMFVPSEQICERGKKVFERIDENTVGVHIRRTDHEDAIAKSPLELFLQKIEEIMQDKSKKIFLATDDKEAEQIIKERWGNRIITYEGKTFSRTNEDGMKDGLVDMLALSKCQCIYGSYASTFNQMAAYIGDKELITVEVEE